LIVHACWPAAEGGHVLSISKLCRDCGGINAFDPWRNKVIARARKGLLPASGEAEPVWPNAMLPKGISGTENVDAR
jgi:hypothetical protein